MTDLDYWDDAARDPEVDTKYMCNLPDADFNTALKGLKGKVLDFGCGTGRLLKPGRSGADISMRLLKIARKRHPKSELLQIQANRIPVGPSHFDNAYSVLVFQHVEPEQVQAYLKEIYRVLKPGGTFIFQFVEGDYHAPQDHNYTHDEMRAYVRQAGFNSQKVKHNYIHPQWIWITATKGAKA